MKLRSFGILACIIVAISSMRLSEYFGKELLGFDKSPISPIMIAIIGKQTVEFLECQSLYLSIICLKLLQELENSEQKKY